MNESVTTEDIRDFVNRLPVLQFQYRHVLTAYSEFVSHDVMTPEEPMKFKPKYFKKRQNATPGRSPWTDEELDVLFEGVRKYGKKWNVIYQNYPIFSRNGKTTNHLSGKFSKLKDLPKWRDLDV